MEFVEHLHTNCALLRAPVGDGGHAYTIVRAETVPFELDAGAALAVVQTPTPPADEDPGTDNRHMVTEREQQVQRSLLPAVLAYRAGIKRLHPL